MGDAEVLRAAADVIERRRLRLSAPGDTMPILLREVADDIDADDAINAYCEAEITVRHESFGCLERAGHEPPHRGPLVSSPCPACEGLDRHVGDCPEIGNDPENPSLLEVTWRDGQPIELVAPRD